MCGCCSFAARWISRRNRSKLRPADRSGGRTLSTIFRSSSTSSARKTCDMPPPPSSRSTRYVSPSARCSRSIKPDESMCCMADVWCRSACMRIAIAVKCEHRRRSGVGAVLRSYYLRDLRSLPPRAPRRSGDPAQHPAEDETVDGIQRVQVEEPYQPVRLEHRGLADHAPGTAARHLELQPRPSGELHLR